MPVVPKSKLSWTVTEEIRSYTDVPGLDIIWRPWETPEFKLYYKKPKNAPPGFVQLVQPGFRERLKLPVSKFTEGAVEPNFNIPDGLEAVWVDQGHDYYFSLSGTPLTRTFYYRGLDYAFHDFAGAEDPTSFKGRGVKKSFKSRGVKNINHVLRYLLWHKWVVEKYELDVLTAQRGTVHYLNVQICPDQDSYQRIYEASVKESPQVGIYNTLLYSKQDFLGIRPFLR